LLTELHNNDYASESEDPEAFQTALHAANLMVDELQHILRSLEGELS
jgi:hypothetical protein